MKRRVLLSIVAVTAAMLPRAYAADSQPLLIYAAASLTNVLQELGTEYQRASGTAVKFSFAASSTLARQIEAGAQADIFFSADSEWMDYLQNRNLIDTGTRTNLLSNRLVLVAPSDSNIELHIASGFPLATALGNQRLAMGDPDSVPAGKYGRSALMTLGVWSQVADRIVRGDSVRTALAFVRSGEAPLGIVYETDAVIDRKVRIVDTFPASSHTPIVYPIALTSTARADAVKFVEFLRGPAAQATFRKYRFTVAK